MWKDEKTEAHSDTSAVRRDHGGETNRFHRVRRSGERIRRGKAVKRGFALLLVVATALMLAACGGLPGAAGFVKEEPAEQDYSAYTIRIYSNSNSSGRAEWLVQAAKEAGFTVSIDDGSVISGDVAALAAANENRDGDILFGLNETRWSQVVEGDYENLSLVNWKPSWAYDVGMYVYPEKAYGLVIQNVLLLYRTDALGTNGEMLHFEHWADVVDSGYTWYRPNKVGGTTNSNINAAILYPYIDPASPAAGVSTEGWKTLWRFCAEGKSGGADYQYGFLPLNRGEVQVSAFYSSALYGEIGAAAESSDDPLRGTLQPENWALVDVADGTYYIAEYIGILEKEGRTAEETEAVTAFADWFGSAETQAAWGAEFNTYPCNSKAANILYPEGVPEIYTLPNFALTEAKDAGVTYAAYVATHAREWANIMTNLGFFWANESDAAPEPDWDNLDWDALCRSGQ